MHWLSELEPEINSPGSSPWILISGDMAFLNKILHSYSISVKPNIGTSGVTAKGNPAME